MPDPIVSSTPPAEWSAQCARCHLLFHSSDWIKLLEASFDVKTDYLWDEDTGCGAALSSFKAGPFRIGYLGFPAGGLVGGIGPDAPTIEHWRSRGGEMSPVAIRIPVSGFVDVGEFELAYEATPETAIVDLPSWSLDNVSGNHRRDVQKGHRSKLEVMDASSDEDAAAVFAIYKETLKRRRGTMRYNATYFEKLVALARQRSDIRVMLAKFDEKISGFTVIVRHGAVASYLHGGIRLEFRHLQPSALLIHEGIEWAQAQGCSSFNLMSSPPGQPSLVWYKEKWGAETREHRTYVLPLRPSYRLFQAAERLYRRFR